MTQKSCWTNMTRRDRDTLFWCCSVISYISLAYGHSYAANATQRAVSACFNQTDKILLMNCSSGYMVRVDRVFYGYSPTGQCGHSLEDCSKDVPKEENYPCVGHHVCGINLPSGTVGRVIPQCNQHTNYMEAHYQCIPVSEVDDICRVSETSQQSGYVKTPLYPINYPTHTECMLTIKTPFPNQKLRLYAIDFHLETNNTKCPDLFRAYDDLRSYSACGSRSRALLFTTQSNVLKLEFMSNHEIRKKGFWLYYEAFPHMETTTTHTTEDTTVFITDSVNSNITTTAAAGFNVSSSPSSNTPVNTSTVTTVVPEENGELTTYTRQQNLHIVYQVDNPFPLGILVGVFLGALLVVLVVLLIVLILRKRKDSNLPNSTSSTSHTAFLGSKNNMQQAGPINCINNHLYKEENTPTQNEHGLTIKDVDATNIFVDSDTVSKESVSKRKQKQEQEVELGLKDKEIALKGPYIDTSDTGEELLYC